ncbi:MAG: VOC family protein [Proteobacteria bacterium]|nr:VOC family protein [Pseudomonadota bacterium]
MSVNGRFLWYDLMTSDVAAAVEFYKAVVGFTMTDWDGPEDYAMFTAGNGEPMGGVVEQADGPSTWTAYIGVDDIDTACGQVRLFGGQVVSGPTEIEGVGRMATILDPSGASQGLICPLDDGGEASDATPTAGEVTWCDLQTSDPEKAVRFWFRLTGWTDVDTMMSPRGKYMMFGPSRSKPALGGMHQSDTSAWLYYLHVDDLDAAVAEVQSRGGQVLMGPMKVPSGDRVAQCVDPQGAPFALHGFA